MNTVRRSVAAFAVVLLTASVATAATAITAEARQSWRILRDSYGVPRVYADDAHDLFFGDGYAQAQERVWQADLVRRTASGRLSALIGPGSDNANVQSDEFFRLYTGGYAALHKQVLALARRTRTALDAFVEGYNAWITQATAHGTLPVEYAGVGQDPQPWTDEDVLATGMISVLQVGTTGSDELSNAAELSELNARLGPSAAAFADSHWTDDPSAPTTVPSAGSLGRRTSTLLTPVRSDLAGAVTASARQRAAHRAMARLGLDSIGHSNAIALSGALTATGYPMLLGGPQIGYSLPQGFVEIGLHGAGYDVTGVVLAGTPGVEIGIGRNFAWTVTTGGDDNQDWYAEQLDPAGHPGRYFYRGTWRPLKCRVETIEVADSAPVSLTACESVHGPPCTLRSATWPCAWAPPTSTSG